VHWLGIVDLTNLLPALVGYPEPAERRAHKTIFEGFMAMVRGKNTSPTWNDVRTALTDFDRAGLRALVQDLHTASKDNQGFLHARLDCPRPQRQSPNHRPHRSASRSVLTASSRSSSSALKRKPKSQATRTGHNHKKVAAALLSRRNAMRVWRSQGSRRPRGLATDKTSCREVNLLTALFCAHILLGH
jgi:hypothetical protein